MAPTICSGKKRQTRTIATTNIRRHGQGSHQLNQTLSNIVNYVAKGSLNSRVSASLRIPSLNPTERNAISNYHNVNNEDSLNYNHTMQTNTTLATETLNHPYHQQISFLSDNAVTSATHSDTENSYDLRLTNETFTNESSVTYASNTTNPSSSSSSTSLSAAPSSLSGTATSSPLPKEVTSSNTSPLSCRKERRFQIHSLSIMQDNHLFAAGDEHSNGNDVTALYEDDNDKVSVTSDKQTNQIHSSNKRKHYYDCSDFDSEEDERDVNSGSSGSDTDMDTDETDSMTSLDTEKSARLKRGGNHPLLRDKLLAKQPNNTKSLNDTDGLLSIAIKTIKLVQRNQLLQRRLTQLQLETSEFIQSVLANPENRHFRDNIKQKAQEVDNI